MRPLLVLASCTAFSQEIYVRSEYQRVGADGQVIARDRVARPREILSPAFARNAFASYIVTINIPAETHYQFEVAQNPVDAVRVALYRQHYNPNGVPDRLEKVSGPIEGKTTQAENQTFWADFWVDANAPVQRIKIELQLWIGDRWVLYPMEARIVETRVPAIQPKFSNLPAPEARADLAMISPWRDYLCRPIASEFKPSETNIRLLQQRNVQQDVALARQKGRDFVLSAFVRAGILAENAVASKWCELPVEQWRGELGAEWYLRVRDALLR